MAFIRYTKLLFSKILFDVSTLVNFKNPNGIGKVIWSCLSISKIAKKSENWPPSWNFSPFRFLRKSFFYQICLFNKQTKRKREIAKKITLDFTAKKLPQSCFSLNLIFKKNVFSMIFAYLIAQESDKKIAIITPFYILNRRLDLKSGLGHHQCAISDR
jgi:hypothetical protein